MFTESPRRIAATLVKLANPVSAHTEIFAKVFPHTESLLDTPTKSINTFTSDGICALFLGIEYYFSDLTDFKRKAITLLNQRSAGFNHFLVGKHCRSVSTKTGRKRRICCLCIP